MRSARVFKRVTVSRRIACSVVGEKELRASGANYPAWVRERYLALPEDIPDRVLTLRAM